MKGFDYLAYYWIAVYEDGTTLRQFEVDGKEHKFSEIDHSKLRHFGWIPFDKNLKLYSIQLNCGDKLKCFRHNRISHINGKQTVVFVLGKEGQTPMWIFEDEIIIADNI